MDIFYCQWGAIFVFFTFFYGIFHFFILQIYFYRFIQTFIEIFSIK